MKQQATEPQLAAWQLEASSGVVFGLPTPNESFVTSEAKSSQVGRIDRSVDPDPCDVGGHAPASGAAIEAWLAGPD